MPWFDTHCHPQLSDGKADDWLLEIERNDVVGAAVVGTTLRESTDGIAYAQAHDGFWATAGLHPHEAKDGLDGLEPLLTEPKVVGVGECGLDYHYEHSPREAQREVFAQQIDWAKTYDKTLIIHTRDAWDDTFGILQSEGPPSRIILHCFTGGVEEAKRCLDLGAVISISGIVTFKNAEPIRDAARMVPADALVVETDSPFLAPVPHRGKPNHPGNVAIVGQFIAELREVDPSDLGVQTTENALRILGISR